jgi:hypothetical protein
MLGKGEIEPIRAACVLPEDEAVRIAQSALPRRHFLERLRLRVEAVEDVDGAFRVVAERVEVRHEDAPVGALGQEARAPQSARGDADRVAFGQVELKPLAAGQRNRVGHEPQRRPALARALLGRRRRGANAEDAAHEQERSERRDALASHATSRSPRYRPGREVWRQSGILGKA